MITFVFAVLLSAPLFPAGAQRQMESLGRGVVAVRQADGRVWVGWRLLGTDPDALAFNLYRSAGGARAVRLNDRPITGPTNFVDERADASKSHSYFVRPVSKGGEGGPSGALWQNVAYNQPPHTSFFVGEGMKRPPRPNIVGVRFKK